MPLTTEPRITARTTTRPVEMYGTTIPADSRVMLIWGAANHDDREFANPEALDVTRKFSRHLAFGHGIHYCLGANLARLEARAAFEEWHRQFPEYHLTGKPQRIVSIWARAYSRIPVAVG